MYLDVADDVWQSVEDFGGLSLKSFHEVVDYIRQVPEDEPIYCVVLMEDLGALQLGEIASSMVLLTAHDNELDTNHALKLSDDLSQVWRTEHFEEIAEYISQFLN